MKKNALLGIAAAIVMVLGCGKPAGEKQSAASSSVNVATIQLPTLKCKTCVQTVKNALSSVDGVESAEVNLEAKNATVKFIIAKLDVGKIKSAISKAGYDADEVKRDSTAYENLAECCK
jgi:Copper chaperone